MPDVIKIQYNQAVLGLLDLTMKKKNYVKRKFICDCLDCQNIMIDVNYTVHSTLPINRVILTMVLTWTVPTKSDALLNIINSALIIIISKNIMTGIGNSTEVFALASTNFRWKPYRLLKGKLTKHKYILLVLSTTNRVRR